jgi:hypothetical protein
MKDIIVGYKDADTRDTDIGYKDVSGWVYDSEGTC